MVVGTDKTAAPEAKLIVSWPSLKRREAELEDLDRNQIPQNSKDIGIARGYGDLRENHEFKAAKEMQTILARRKAELEQVLARAEGNDFTNPDTSKVTLGTKVSLKDTASGEELSYTILGAWDSDLSQGIISYQTAVARALLNHAAGDTIELSTDEGKTRQVVIQKIEGHQIDLSVPA
jgi:transcription elongation GreA/GreB family factor